MNISFTIYYIFDFMLVYVCMVTYDLDKMLLMKITASYTGGGPRDGYGLAGYSK